MNRGFLYNVSPRIFTGLVFMDVNQPDIGLKETEKLPLSVKAGVSYRDKTLKVPLDIVMKDGDFRINAGAERWFFKNAFAMRGGTSVGSRNLNDISVGLSFNFKAFQIDYGFRYPLSGIEGTIGSHLISLICRFGRVPDDELEPGSIEAELVKLEKDRRELKARLKDAVEMKEKIEQVLIEEALARVREKIRAVAYYPSTKRTKTKKTVSSMKTHIVKKGETLRSIAQKYFGTRKRWLDIYNLNKEKIGRGGSLKKGTLILIPAEITGYARDEEGGARKPVSALIPKPVKPVTKKAVVRPKKPVRPVKKTGVVLPKKKEVTAKKRSHTVKEGETIRSIAEKYYNNAARWKDIYKVNKRKIKMGRVEEGTVLDIP